MPDKTEQIVNEVSQWNGVSAHSHRFGGTEFRYGKPEIGHIHRNGLVDIPFPVKIRDELIKEKLVHPHHILPETGWISFYVRNNEDIDKALVLFRLSYLRYAIKRNDDNTSYKDELLKLDISSELKSIFNGIIH